MPPPEISNRLQSAVYWEKQGVDTYGEPTLASPIELVVRWVGKRKQVTGPNGEPIGVDATVIVDRRITIGSIMWLGSLSEWYGTGSAETSSTENKPELMQVMTYDETPDLKNRLSQRQVTVAFFRGTLPALA